MDKFPTQELADLCQEHLALMKKKGVEPELKTRWMNLSSTTKAPSKLALLARTVVNKPGRVAASLALTGVIGLWGAMARMAGDRSAFDEVNGPGRDVLVKNALDLQDKIWKRALQNNGSLEGLDQDILDFCFTVRAIGAPGKTIDEQRLLNFSQTFLEHNRIDQFLIAYGGSIFQQKRGNFFSGYVKEHVMRDFSVWFFKHGYTLDGLSLIGGCHEAFLSRVGKTDIHSKHHFYHSTVSAGCHARRLMREVSKNGSDDFFIFVLTHALFSGDVSYTQNNFDDGFYTAASKRLNDLSDAQKSNLLSKILNLANHEKKLFGRRQSGIDRRLADEILLSLPPTDQRLALGNSIFKNIPASKAVRNKLAMDKGIASQAKKSAKKKAVKPETEENLCVDLAHHKIGTPEAFVRKRRM